jgi:hypothetical protein
MVLFWFPEIAVSNFRFNFIFNDPQNDQKWSKSFGRENLDIKDDINKTF